MSAFYNENDPKALAWLKELAKQGHIPDGDFNGDSIEHLREVRQSEAHFFAGIGGWPYALRLAGWPAGRPVWTGSCPCQPFSQAGKRKGTADKRHLWPEFHRLIADHVARCRDEGKPLPTIFGEQVASKDGRLWLAGVHADLEALGFEFGAADLCAAGIGSPHIRQRLYWVAYAQCDGRRVNESGRGSERGIADRGDRAGIDFNGLPYATSEGWQGRVSQFNQTRPQLAGGCGADDSVGGLLHAIQPRLEGHARHGDGGSQPGWQHETPDGSTAAASCLNVHAEWSDFIIVHDTKGKARRLKPGIAPLVDGVPNRVAKLRGLGNAIIPQLAAEFVQAFLDAEKDFRDVNYDQAPQRILGLPRLPG